MIGCQLKTQRVHARCGYLRTQGLLIKALGASSACDGARHLREVEGNVEPEGPLPGRLRLQHAICVRVPQTAALRCSCTHHRLSHLQHVNLCG